jgi:hypothetical protein
MDKGGTLAHSLTGIRSATSARAKRVNRLELGSPDIHLTRLLYLYALSNQDISSKQLLELFLRFCGLYIFCFPVSAQLNSVQLTLK